MSNTNFQTIFQMPGIVNDIVKQATGRDSVSQIDMDFVTVGQDKQTVPHAIDYTAIASFVNNNQLPMTVLAKIAPVQSGEGDPSSVNVRPITGWSGVNVTGAGANIWDGEWELGTINTSTGGDSSSTARIRSKNYIPILPNTKYCYMRKSGGTQNLTGRVCYYDMNKEFISGDSSFPGGSSTYASPATFTTPANAYYMRISPPDKDAEISINYPYTNTEYHSGTQNSTYAITFPEEAGTVYGGVLNVNTGVLTVTMGEIESYNGETLPGAWMSDRDVYAAGTTPSEGAQVVYELAAPVIYQCEPEVINSLIGYNNVFADTGDVSVSYTSYIPVI